MDFSERSNFLSSVYDVLGMALGDLDAPSSGKRPAVLVPHGGPRRVHSLRQLVCVACCLLALRSHQHHRFAFLQRLESIT